MSTIRKKLILAANNRAVNLTDTSIHNDIHKQYEFKKQTVLADKSLTNDEKTEAIRLLAKSYDQRKVKHNKGTKRFCEYCVRNYLKAKFSNWTSGNDDIDSLIQKCQMETLAPKKVIEWIPYNNLQ